MNPTLPDLSTLDNVGVVGICVLVVLALFLGWIAPRRVVTDALAQRDRALDLLENKTERDEAIMDLLLAIKNGPPGGGSGS